MQLEPFYAAAGAFVAALAALLIYHLIVVRPSLTNVVHLLELHDNLLSGDNGSASGRLGALEAAASSARATAQALDARIGELEALAATDVSRAGFIRYDAFPGSGSGLSYALALLNRQGDGVVITSIYSREDTRTFGKPVAAFKPTVAASEEELEAIERARKPAS
jgi:hypothetical protein